MWDCVKEAERLSASDHAKFLRYEAQMNVEGWEATPADVKRMEVLFFDVQRLCSIKVQRLHPRIMVLISFLQGSFDYENHNIGPLEKA